MSASRGPAPHSAFRTVVFVTSTVAAILFVLATPAVVRYGDRLRDFGWLAARSGGVLVVGRVDPAGPAGGLLQEGDVVLEAVLRRATSSPT